MNDWLVPAIVGALFTISAAVIGVLFSWLRSDLSDLKNSQSKTEIEITKIGTILGLVQSRMGLGEKEK